MWALDRPCSRQLVCLATPLITLQPLRSRPLPVVIHSLGAHAVTVAVPCLKICSSKELVSSMSNRSTWLRDWSCDADGYCSGGHGAGPPLIRLEDRLSGRIDVV